jgi:hypothetical protein
MAKSSDWREAMIVFHDAPAVDRSKGRAARHAQTRQVTEKRRGELLAELADAGLAGEAEVREASALPSLLVKGSPRALEHLKQAPAVRDVYELPSDAGLEPI